MRRFRSSPNHYRQSLGFTIAEMLIVLSLSALFSVYAISQFNNKSEESLAQAAAVYLVEVGKASRDYTLVNFESLANAVNVPGVAVYLAPTLAELAATGRLPAQFPIAAGSVPGQLSVGITIRRQNCPGANCLISALACTTTPITLGGNVSRFDLASTMTTHQGGTGGQSLDGAGGFIRGPLLNVANPMGNVPGIVCNGATVTTAEFERFVRIRDTRDPDLQGPLSVVGKVAGDRFAPVGQYALGAACNAADEGNIARRLGAAGLVVCQSSVWSPIGAGPTAEAGASCTPEGAVATAVSGEQLLCVGGKYRGMSTIVRAGTPNAACSNVGTTAIDTANSNETLICRLNPSGGTQRYMRLRDVTQHMVFVTALEVKPGQVLTRPTCSAASGSVPISLVQLIPKAFSSPDGGVDVRVIETPTTWTVVMRDGHGAVLVGSSVAIAQVFCYYP